MTIRFSGGCLCGAVRYMCDERPVMAGHCHCEDCQRLTGSGHSTGAMYSVGQVVISGPIGEYTLTSNAGNQVTRVFCPSCGSPIYGRNSGMPGFITLSLGTFNDARGFEPAVVIFARNRKPWDLMDNSLATFDDQPAWKPGAGA